METIQIDLLTLLGVMEFILALGAVGLFLWWRSNKLARRVEALQTRTGQPAEVPEPIAFDQYLRDEVIRNQAFIEQAAASQDAQERDSAQLLEMRKQFLELELAAQAEESNPVEFCRTIADGMRGFIEQLRPEPATVVEKETVEMQSQPDVGPDASEDDSSAAPRELRDTHDEELDHLRQVINNQQDAMAALRAGLKDNGNEVEGAEGILEKLDQFERESIELQQALQVLEAENERLKQARQANEPAGVEVADRDPAQLSGLKSMVGKQQATISTLQDLLRDLAPEASKARELQDAIARIHRTNEELDGCVAVLEDENAMLRAELEEIQAYLDQQDKERVEADATVEQSGSPADAATDEDSEEMMREMEIKVQELEALVEFKDAAIEEMEKQYNALQAKYLAATGKKRLD